VEYFNTFSFDVVKNKKQQKPSKQQLVSIANLPAEKSLAEMLKHDKWFGRPFS
jgi:hypothetical protein